MAEKENEGVGGFEGADALRNMLKKGLKEHSQGSLARVRIGGLGGQRQGAGDKQARAEFMKEFDALCARYGVDSMDFKGFVRGSLEKLL